MFNITEFINDYLFETAEIAKNIDRKAVEKAVDILTEIRSRGGRVFFIGVGGGAGTGSHAANDFNKIAKIPTACLSDNSSLLTALANDEGWESIFRRQMEMHRFNSKDCLFVYSVGGGTENVSKNLVVAIEYAKEIGAKIIGVVGRETGATAQKADACVIVPCPNDSRRTPHTEDFQLVINHLLVNLLARITEDNAQEE